MRDPKASPAPKMSEPRCNTGLILRGSKKQKVVRNKITTLCRIQIAYGGIMLASGADMFLAQLVGPLGGFCNSGAVNRVSGAGMMYDCEKEVGLTAGELSCVGLWEGCRVDSTNCCRSAHSNTNKTQFHLCEAVSYWPNPILLPLACKIRLLMLPTALRVPCAHL